VKIIEQWQSLGQPGLFELLAELEPDEDHPRPGTSLRVPGLGEVNVETVLLRSAPPASSDPPLIRMDVWLTPSKSG
jgi:hypothetical protein